MINLSKLASLCYIKMVRLIRVFTERILKSLKWCRRLSFLMKRTSLFTTTLTYINDKTTMSCLFPLQVQEMTFLICLKITLLTLVQTRVRIWILKINNTFLWLKICEKSFLFWYHSLLLLRGLHHSLRFILYMHHSHRSHVHSHHSHFHCTFAYTLIRCCNNAISKSI